MILGLKTNDQTAEIWVDGVRHQWSAERQMAQKLLGQIKELVGEVSQITGIVFYNSIGSFTGLRIGATIVNTLADSLNIAIVGSNGMNWYEDGVARLADGQNDKRILPNYGRSANITQPKK